MAGLNVDGGVRLGDSRLFARGQLAAGISGSSEGSYQQLRAGIEARSCVAREWPCGFELGRQLRVRGSAELVSFARRNREPQPMMKEHGVGAACSLGLGYAF